jgi:hypothetical protein
VRRSLGLADPATVRELLLHLAAGDAAETMRATARAFDSGADARQLLRDMSRLARAAELVALGAAQSADLAADEEETCSRLAATARRGLWVEAIDAFGTAEINLRQPVDARTQVELALLRLLHGGGGSPHPDGSAVAALTARVAELERRLTGGSSEDVPVTGRATPPPAVEVAAGPVALPASPVTEPPMAVVEPPVGEESAAPPPPPRSEAPADLDGWQALWPAIVDAVNRRDPMLAGVLRSCRPLESAPGRLTVGAPYGFHLERLQERQKARLLDEVVSELAGAPCTVEAVFSGTDAPARPAPPPAPDAPDATAAVLATFPGSRITASRLRDTAADGPA